MDSAQFIEDLELISPEQLEQAVEFQKETGSNIYYVICKMRFTTDQKLIEAVRKSCSCDVEKLENFAPKPDLFNKFPREFLEGNLIVPLYQELGTLYVGIPNPADIDLLDEIRLIAGEKVEALAVSPVLARNAVEDFFVPEKSSAAISDKFKKPHKSHSDARQKLNDLVQELESQARHEHTEQQPPVQAAAESNELYVYETRELLFGLIKCLSNKGLVSVDEIIAAAIQKDE